MKKCICVGSGGWITEKRFLGIKYLRKSLGPDNGDLLTIKKTTEDELFFEEWGKEGFAKNEFIELSDEEYQMEIEFRKNAVLQHKNNPQ